MMTADIRLRDLIGRCSDASKKVQLLGFPSDEGVRRNGGRPGASGAPAEIMAHLLRMTPVPTFAAASESQSNQPVLDYPKTDQPKSAGPKTEHSTRERHIGLLECTGDLEMIECSGDVEKDQSTLGYRVSELLKANIFPIIIGGGHETAFGHFLGYSMAQKDVTIVNLDAHTDVRPLKNGLAHSGSPFYQALNHPSGRCKGYKVCGLNPFSVAEEQAHFILEHGGSIHFGVPDKDQFRRLLPEGGHLSKEGRPSADHSLASNQNLAADQNKATDHKNAADHKNATDQNLQARSGVMITFDMDVVHQAHAPGVSAPNPAGISSAEWIELARTAASHPSVTSFDLCEVNPRFDADHQTVRLAALTIWSVLEELSKRLI